MTRNRRDDLQASCSTHAIHTLHELQTAGKEQGSRAGSCGRQPEILGEGLGGGRLELFFFFLFVPRQIKNKSYIRMYVPRLARSGRGRMEGEEKKERNSPASHTMKGRGGRRGRR